MLPALSLKFLDDLCTAYAWLQIKGYSLETVSEYTAILKYGRPPPGGFPPHARNVHDRQQDTPARRRADDRDRYCRPLKALHIPENALDERALAQAEWKIAGLGGAAELLGVKPTTLNSKLKAFGIRRRPR